MDIFDILAPTRATQITCKTMLSIYLSKTTGSCRFLSNACFPTSKGNLSTMPLILSSILCCHLAKEFFDLNRDVLDLYSSPRSSEHIPKTSRSKRHFPYLKADLVLRLLGVALDSIGRRHGRSVDVAVICDDQAVASVVHLRITNSILLSEQ